MWIRVAGAVIVAGLIAGCEDTWLGGGEDEAPLPGERISVLLLERGLEPDPELANDPVVLPRPLVNEAWPVAGGNANHAPHHVAVGDRLEIAWSRGVGEGENDDNLILSPPIVAAGHVYLLDSETTVFAIDLASGTEAWERELIPEYEDDEASLGGGVAYESGRLFVTTAFGDIMALDATTGDTVWQQNLSAPLRAAPAVADGRVFAITYDNRLVAVSALDGEILWTHEAIVESAGLLGAAVPAVSGDLVIASFSSGEVVALRVENGRQAWTDSLIFQGRLGARTNLSDIDASPVIDRGVVILISQSGRLVATDLRSGLRIWDQEIPSTQMPWVAGDYIYVVTVDAEVVCLRRGDGRIRWVTALPRFEDPDEREDPIIWSGPVLAGDRLVVTGSNGTVYAVSPYSGALLGQQDMPDGVRLPPVVADGTMYLLTMDADLLALR
jgi:outer membrane protein assembly factor BamB